MSESEIAPKHTETKTDISAAMADIVGSEHVLTDEKFVRDYAHDKLPYANYVEREGRLAGVAPRIAVRPGNADEVQKIAQLAKRLQTQVIPFGNGSGVLGGTIPISDELMVDLRRMDRIVSIDVENAMVTVQAGTNGGLFEAELNSRGYTCGHLPQSLEISTVGGWAACRGGGQASSRFGKIEDIVLGLKAVLPDGSCMDIRPVSRRAVGPSLRDLMIGSEGAYGIITELTLRIWKLPEAEQGVVLAFPSLQAAWDAARDIMQAELRPTVARIYDQVESHERTEGLGVFKTHPFLAILMFSGRAQLAAVEEQLSLEIAQQHGAVTGPVELFDQWKKNRYVAFSQKWQAQGFYNDTIEVTGKWSEIPAMFDAMGKAVKAIYPDVHFGAHWSHIYPEGACQYMTIRLPQMPQEKALQLHDAMWDAIQSLTLDHDGSISHHHGVGVFRNRWLARELGGGLAALQQIKDALDPGNLFNPGKVGLRPPAGSVVVGKG
ncbi:FAD-binding oxidoreductase [Hoeflea sp. TYP-13]|uniref:FAD-binding oxidoreductase n=1 Tax=Hoeflea sp. TYP-13 TaxID=3230023 RepID=UPI0034C5F127